jgi:hypothetical protein
MNNRTKKKAAEKPERKSVHVGLKARDVRNLETVRAVMRRDPVQGLMLDDKIPHAKAALYAIAFCAAHGPAHVTTG